MSYYVDASDKKQMLFLEQLKQILGKSYDRIFILESLETVRRGISLAWTMVCLIFMFMMQAGFCLMATGAARQKSKSSILTHQILIICVTALVYFILSSYLVIGAEGGLLGIQQTLPVIEKENLDPRTLDKIEQELFTYMKILTCATIACIQLQERTLIETFGILSFVIAGVIAPIGLAWIKGDGWLERLGFKDSTGCSVVYMCGGVCGFVGNLMLGPRFSIFSKQSNNTSKKTSYQMQRILERKQKRDKLNENEARLTLSGLSRRISSSQNTLRYDQRTPSQNFPNGDATVISLETADLPSLFGQKITQKLQHKISSVDVVSQPQDSNQTKKVAAGSFRPYDSSSSSDNGSARNSLSEEREPKKKQFRTRRNSSGYTQNSLEDLTELPIRRDQSGSFEKKKTAQPKEQNHSMSFGDSDGSVHKNSDDEQLLNKGKKSPVPEQNKETSRKSIKKEGKNSLNQSFDSVRDIKKAQKQINISSQNYLENTSKFKKDTSSGDEEKFTLGESMTPSSTPHSKKSTNKNSFISSNKTYDSSDATMNTQTTSYVNAMTEFKTKFGEFRALDNKELELVLQLYDNHFNTPHQISNSAYYISGALIVLVSIQFLNAQNFTGYDTSYFGLNKEENEVLSKERSLKVINTPEKVIMITIMAMSTAGLSFIAMRGWFNSIIHGNNFGCFYIANAMLSGAVSISATCDAIEVWHGVIISLIGTFFYSLSSKLLLRSEIDDPQEAFLIFGVQGLWGTIAVGIFDRHDGILYDRSGKQILMQLLGAGCLIVWTVVISLLFFSILRVHKRFRVGNIYEVVGLDQMTKKSDFDDLLSMETLSKIETKQRGDEGIKKKANQ